MQKTTRRGFTLVEMTVVTAIVAILALIGIGVLVNLRVEPTLDSAAQDISSALREAQNRAISVASAPDGSVPVAWGVEVDPSNKSYQIFYINDDASVPPFSRGNLSKVPNPALSELTVTKKLYYFTSPFGQYYTSDNSPSSWSYRLKKPNDAIPSGLTATVSTITLKVKSSTKVITVEKNGDIYVQ